LNRKLAQKEFENGLVYMKMEYFKSATVSFDFVLEKFHDTPYAEHALLRKVEALVRRKRYQEGRQELEKFFDRYPSSELKAEAESLKSEIDGKLSAPPQAQEKPEVQKPDSMRATTRSER
ncbi:MAG: hypothetical protein HY562_07000, partial [Ignavibacteriales bacterium]|nr:hypothetical protein [Ignavibacteriales bacterium]